MLCPAFRDAAGRTFRCTLEQGHFGDHSGISGPQRQSWSDLAQGAMGQRNPASADSLRARVAPEPTDPGPQPYVPLRPSRIPHIGPRRQPYPSTANLAVPGSAVPPVENQDVLPSGNHGEEPIQQPYVELPEHLDE